MRASLFLVTFLVLATALTCLFLPSKVSASTFAGVHPRRHGDAKAMIVESRKLKDYRGGSDRIYLDDYRPIDPAPNSKASIRPGPIQHGTPLMPYIPKPAPSPPPGRPTR